MDIPEGEGSEGCGLRPMRVVSGINAESLPRILLRLSTWLGYQQRIICRSLGELRIIQSQMNGEVCQAHLVQYAKHLELYGICTVEIGQLLSENSTWAIHTLVSGSVNLWFYCDCTHFTKQRFAWAWREIQGRVLGRVNLSMSFTLTCFANREIHRYVKRYMTM